MAVNIRTIFKFFKEKKRGLLRATGYIGALLLLFVLDNAVESLGERDESSAAQKYSTIFSPSALYPYLTGAGSKTGEAAHTVVITIGKEESSYLGDPCQIRLLVADIIASVQDAMPSAIAIDRSFNAHGCASPIANDSLQNQLTSSKIPVILGQATQSFDDIQTKSPLLLRDLAEHGFSETDLFISDEVSFADVRQDQLNIGLMRLDFDNRKIPLSWHVRKMVDGTSAWYDTLGAATVRIVKRGEKLEAEIQALQSNHRNPIGSFFREDQLFLISALNLVCSNISTASRWHECRQPQRSKVDFEHVKGRVLVVGVVDPAGHEDVQESAVGKVSGVILQANYIEALLAHSFLKSIPGWLQVVIGLCWFVLIEIILRKWKGSLLRTVVYPLILISLLWIAISVVLLYCGIYVELLFPSILVIVVAHLSDHIEEALRPNALEAAK